MPANVRRLNRTEGRRIAIRAQLLDANRPRDLSTVVDRLTFLQLDPTAAVAPSADLVAWSRLGNAYEPAHLQEALERDRTLFEHRAQPTEVEPPLAIVRPMADLGLFLADMAAWVRGRDAPGRMGARERCLSATHPRPAPRIGTAVVARHPRYERGVLAVERLDE